MLLLYLHLVNWAPLSWWMLS